MYLYKRFWFHFVKPVNTNFVFLLIPAVCNNLYQMFRTVNAVYVFDVFH